MIELNDALREGRRSLEGITGYELLEDLFWNDPLSRWVFKFRLNGTYEPTDDVPQDTFWFCHLTNSYPYGPLEILPDRDFGIKATFPHMNYNEEVDAPWRSGNVCLKTTVGSWGKVYYNNEPFQAVKRLRWHIKRLKSWLSAAATGSLVNEGDPFEFPHFPRRNRQTWAFIEDSASFTNWQSSASQFGTVKLQIPEFNNQVLAVTEFCCDTASIHTCSWGKAMSESRGNKHEGLWFRLAAIPVLPPWQMPIKWDELFQACERGGFDLKAHLLKKLSSKRDVGRFKHIALGFPVSAFVGYPNERMHWFAAQLPPLPSNLKGFRAQSSEYYHAAFKLRFRKGTSIDWFTSENWAKDQIGSRGSVSEELKTKRIALIGAGAIGSAFIELVTRLGCERVTIIDDDSIQVGNFSRHTLDMRSLGSSKSQQLAMRINSIFPSVNANAHTLNLNDYLRIYGEAIKSNDLIIDATASDSVLIRLSNELQSTESILVSLSTNVNATRLFCFMVRPNVVDLFTKFNTLMQPWHEKQHDENPEPVFTLEGIGCWHPIFPARLDDLTSLISPTVRQLETFAAAQIPYELCVVERQTDHSIRIIKSH